MRFRLIGGQHDDRKYRDNPDGTRTLVGGRVYRDGDIIESDRDLCRMFVNKFQRLADADDAFDEMSLKELRAYAKKQGIDLDGIGTRAEVVAELRRVQAIQVS